MVLTREVVTRVDWVNKDGETRAFYDIAVVTFPPTHAPPLPTVPPTRPLPYQRMRGCESLYAPPSLRMHRPTSAQRAVDSGVRCRSLSRRAKGRSRSWSCIRRPFSSRCRTVSQLNHLGSPVP
jgi:hypothetical protein